MISENKKQLTPTMKIIIIQMLQKFMEISLNSEQAENTKNAGRQKQRIGRK